jgi:hypothetical protein
MRFTLDIDYAPAKMERSKRRMQARDTFQYVDRVPVGFCVVPRFFAPRFGLPYQDFFRDVETQYYWQLQFAKFRIENIPEDIVCHGPTITVQPYFDNVVNASACGAEIAWPENETLQACPTIKTVEEMERFQIPAPDAGLWGRVRDWWHQMRELTRETQITFNGQDGQVEMGRLGIGGEGPHMIAVDLAGTNFYWWMAEYPEACHRFLAKITQGMIRAETALRQLDPRPRGGYGIAEDSIQIASPAMFREFCVPYDNLLYDTFGRGLVDGRGMHMCGVSTHLHQALIEDEHISSFNVFGYQVTPEVAARNLGGKTRLWGNIDPMLMLRGSKTEVKRAAHACLEAMAPCGGMTLGDGANVCPGTPLENLAALTEAAEEYGLPRSPA